MAHKGLLSCLFISLIFEALRMESFMLDEPVFGPTQPAFQAVFQGPFQGPFQEEQEEEEEEALEEAFQEPQPLFGQEDFDAYAFISGFVENPHDFGYKDFRGLNKGNLFEVFNTILDNGVPEIVFSTKFLADLFRCLRLPEYEGNIGDVIQRMFDIFHTILEMIHDTEDVALRCAMEVDYKFAVAGFITKVLEHNEFTYSDEIPDEYDEVILEADLIDILGNNPKFLPSREQVEHGLKANRLINKFIQSRKGYKDIIAKSSKSEIILRILACDYYEPESINILIESFCLSDHMFIFTKDFYDAFANVVNEYMKQHECGIDRDQEIITKLLRIVTILANSNTPINGIDREIACGIGDNEGIIQAIFELSDHIDQKNKDEKDPKKHIPGVSKQVFFRFAVYAFINNMFEDPSELLSAEDENMIFVGVILLILRKDYGVFGLEVNHVIGTEGRIQNVFEFLNTITRSENQSTWTQLLAEMFINEPESFPDDMFKQLLMVDEFAFEEHHLVDRYASYVIANIESMTQSKEIALKILEGSPMMTPTILRSIRILSQSS